MGLFVSRFERFGPKLLGWSSRGDINLQRQEINSIATESYAPRGKPRLSNFEGILNELNKAEDHCRP